VKILLDVVDFISINTKTDEAVDALVVALGGEIDVAPHTIKPFRCGDGVERVWRVAEVLCNGVRVHISSPHREAHTAAADGPAIELVTP
jgi:hypothetical protein